MPRGSPRIHRWIQDGVFQLQRRAYEAYGQGTWRNLDEEVPMIDVSDKLEELPLKSLPTSTVIDRELMKEHDVETGSA